MRILSYFISAITNNDDKAADWPDRFYEQYFNQPQESILYMVDAVSRLICHPEDISGM